MRWPLPPRTKWHLRVCLCRASQSSCPRGRRKEGAAASSSCTTRRRCTTRSEQKTRTQHTGQRRRREHTVSTCLSVRPALCLPFCLTVCLTIYPPAFQAMSLSVCWTDFSVCWNKDSWFSCFTCCTGGSTPSRRQPFYSTVQPTQVLLPETAPTQPPHNTATCTPWHAPRSEDVPDNSTAGQRSIGALFTLLSSSYSEQLLRMSASGRNRRITCWFTQTGIWLESFFFPGVNNSRTLTRAVSKHQTRHWVTVSLLLWHWSIHASLGWRATLITQQGNISTQLICVFWLIPLLLIQHKCKSIGRKCVPTVKLNCILIYVKDFWYF